MTGRTRPAAAAPAASPAPTATDHESSERRSFVVAGLALAGVLVALVIAAAVFSGDAGEPRRDTSTTEACAPGDTVCEAAGAEVERPGIIPQPGSGQAPDDPGDPGGALQVAVLALIVVGLGTIVALVVRSGRRARRAALEGPPSADGPDRS